MNEPTNTYEAPGTNEAAPAGAKAAVTEYYQDMGAFPQDNATAGELYGATLVVRPQAQAGYVDWSCYSQDIQPKNLPAACRR